METRAVVVLRKTLEEAVAPASLFDALESLRRSGVIGGYAPDGESVRIWGDLRRAESLLQFASDALANDDEIGPKAASAHDYRREYFTQARAYMHTASYRALPRVSRRVWALHAEGRSFALIAVQLGIGEQQVRTAVRGARMAARLQPSSWKRGGESGGRPALRVGCSEPGCDRAHHGRGLCSVHNLRRWRQTRRC